MGQIPADCPNSLKVFIQTCRRLGLSRIPEQRAPSSAKSRPGQTAHNLRLASAENAAFEKQLRDKRRYTRNILTILLMADAYYKKQNTKTP
ncbi:hypothetical protein CYMTET_11241 [Cymbomonas tetramitiformis]|uniref:Uncharacterized protein n=1 Tax=Cymbomonas tetramitiformis TaxID=36881 RepID=A0AAE0GMN9_9CHLO|nr:hypothetical protein CYMTET_11241 [Cymbomonas tetramitiformis]